MLSKKRKQIITASVIIFLIMVTIFIYRNFFKPDITVIVEYSEVPPIIQGFLKDGITAYYRGFKVGKSSRIELSNDKKHILFYLDIYYKHLNLPQNTKIILKTEDIFGARYFDLIYPVKPSSDYISNGDTIKGYASYERLDKYLVADIESGKLKKIIDNVIYLTDMAKLGLNGDNSALLAKVKASGGDIESILHNVKEIMADPKVKSDIKSTIQYSSRSLKDINQVLESRQMRQIIAKSPNTIDTALKNLEMVNQNIPKVNDNITQVNKTIPQVDKSVNIANSQLSTTNSNLQEINKKVPAIPPNLLTKADKSLTKFDCLTSELSKILSKRFILIRLMFGNPAKNLSKCK